MQLQQQAICRECRTEFDIATTGRKPNYCSQGCKQKAYRKRNAKPVTKPDCNADWVKKAVDRCTTFRLFTKTTRPAPGAKVAYFVEAKPNQISMNIGGVKVMSKMLFEPSYDPAKNYGSIIMYTCV